MTYSLEAITKPAMNLKHPKTEKTEIYRHYHLGGKWAFPNIKIRNPNSK